jgi:hypothetical protein
MHRVGIFTFPNREILIINVSRQVKPRLVREPSVVDFHRNQGCPEALVNVLRKKQLHAYHISMVHELKQPDQVKRVAYCRWFQTLLKENPGILDYTLRHPVLYSLSTQVGVLPLESKTSFHSYLL